MESRSAGMIALRAALMAGSFVQLADRTGVYTQPVGTLRPTGNRAERRRRQQQEKREAKRGARIG